MTLWHEEGLEQSQANVFSLAHHFAVKPKRLKLIPKLIDPVFSDFKETFKFDGLSQQGLEPFLYIAQCIKHMA